MSGHQEGEQKQSGRSSDAARASGLIARAELSSERKTVLYIHPRSGKRTEMRITGIREAAAKRRKPRCLVCGQGRFTHEEFHNIFGSRENFLEFFNSKEVLDAVFGPEGGKADPA